MSQSIHKLRKKLQEKSQECENFKHLYLKYLQKCNVLEAELDKKESFTIPFTKETKIALNDLESDISIFQKVVKND